MDANYRRDEPGLSPMGMELVPVYAGDVIDNGPGVVSLSEEVQAQIGLRTVTAKKGQIKPVIRSSGRVLLNAERTTRISPRVPGWVDMLFVHSEGERVYRGDKLFAFYSPDLIKVQENLLAAIRSGSQTAILNAEDELRILDLDENIIQRLRREGAVQQSVVYTAKQEGLVNKLLVEEGQFLKQGDAVLNLASLDSVWVELDVFASQAALIESGQKLTITTPSIPEKSWRAEVDFIPPLLDDLSKALKLRSVIDNSELLLKPNTFVEAEIHLPPRSEAVLVPRQAIIHVGQQARVVFDLGEGLYKSVKVTTGLSDGEYIEVLEGLQEGERIVNSAHFLIDSESSKTSDFLRMDEIVEEEKYPPTWVNAVVKNILLDERKIRLQHERIEAWKMPSMTMNFSLSEQVDVGQISIGDIVRVQVADGDPLFKVLTIEPDTAGDRP